VSEPEKHLAILVEVRETEVETDADFLGREIDRVSTLLELTASQLRAAKTRQDYQEIERLLKPYDANLATEAQVITLKKRWLTDLVKLLNR
jgi:hypothetical protein